MPVLQDRVQETTTTGGTGTITLAGAVTGYRSFAQAFTIGDITYYTIDNGNGEWEIGVGTVGSGTLSRDSVLESSNANALVNFSAGTKRVFCSAPTKVLLPNQESNSGKVLTTNGTDPAWTTTLNGMTIGNITPGSGAFTTLSASSTVSGTGFSTYLASPPAIGGTTPAAGSFTTLSSTGNTTLGDASGDTLTINAGTTTFAQGTANGVAYLNGSKVLTTGSALTFDGTNLGVGAGSLVRKLTVAGGIELSSASDQKLAWGISGSYLNWIECGGGVGTTYMRFATGNTEAMRIDASSNVGIGLSNPDRKLHVSSNVYPQLRLVYPSVITGDIGLNSSGNMDFGFNGAAASLTLASSGNLGLGVTPSAWNTSAKVVETGSGGLYSFSTIDTEVFQNCYLSASSGWIYKNNGAALRYSQYNGQHIWYNSNGVTGTANATWTPTQAMTLDASGNLVVGQTSNTGNQKVSWSGPNSGDTITSAWSNASSASINVSTLFSTLNVAAGATLSFILQIATSSSSAAASSSRILCLRRGDSTWHFGTPETIGSGVTITPSGSGNIITLTFSGGGQYGLCRVMAVGY